MGHASSLFFSGFPEQQTLHRRITPSDEQFEEQQDRWNALADHLIADLKARSKYPIRTWLQGSYKFGTQVRPVRKSEEFDIDLGIYYQWDGEPDDGNFRPWELIVQASLNSYSDANPDDVEKVGEQKPRCCRLHYKNGFHIDVPSYHLSENDRRHLATTMEWEGSDPKAIYLWFRDCFSDSVRVKIRRQVKYLKAWSALKFEIESRPSSILLTVLAANAGRNIAETKIGADDDTLRDVLRNVVATVKSKSKVANPVDESENLCRLNGSEMNRFVERLEEFLDVAERATEMDNELSAAGVWQESFEHLLPMPEVKEFMLKQTKNSLMVVPMPEVAVRAVSRTNPNIGRYRGMNEIGPIPKNCKIEFEIINADAFSGSEIVWMVRNEGREAENTNDLGHKAGSGISAEETSSYKGTHFMDCLIRRYGRTVAMRRIAVTVTGADVPRRNLLRRPEWTKLRVHR